ncbi:MAG: hypothetical protein COU69_03140 [Candidatus Pacebacteria bacterium CG10_big_fil_rev_8_21_14_0_10_56_10]|nr:MAG: hypothetical protein COU69_03140 [Candidatus Pacebacteria bacterium CG10_big_fil_rev_8_21_14_0_10_56_10]
MGLATVFYVLGIAVFSILLVFLLAVATALVVVVLKVRRLRHSLRQMTIEAQSRALIESLRQTPARRFLPLMGVVPLVLKYFWKTHQHH